MTRELSDTIKRAEAMAATGASATHIIELFRSLTPPGDGVMAASCVTDSQRGTRLVGPHGGLIERMPNPTDADLADPLFEAVWEATKTWDVNAPEYYVGYCGMNGSHVMLILNAIHASAAPVAREGWIPCSERLPESRMLVLVTDGTYSDVCCLRDDSWQWRGGQPKWAIDFRPTHWQPLPAAPAGSGEGK